MFKSLFGFFNDQYVGEVFDEVKVIRQDQMLSQSELQTLQRMMAQYIQTHEQVRKEFKEEALSYPVGMKCGICFSGSTGKSKQNSKVSLLCNIA